MKVKRDALVTLLQEIGVATAPSYDNELLTKRVRGIKALAAEEKPESEESQALLAEIIAAQDDDEQIEVEGAEPESASEKKSKKKKGKKMKTEEKAKKGKKSKPKKEPKARDRFGSGLGTRAAKINAVFGKKAKAPTEILKEAKQKPPLHAHLKKLLAYGFIKKDKEGKYTTTGKEWKPGMKWKDDSKKAKSSKDDEE